MGLRGPRPTPLRDYVLGMYLRGELGTLEEGALIAGVTRSRVRAWLNAARLDWMARREHYVARHRARAVAMSEGKRVARPSRRELRMLGEQAKRDWDRNHAHHDMPTG